MLHALAGVVRIAAALFKRSAISNFRFGAHFFTALGLMFALGVATDPDARASSSSPLSPLFSARHSGWQSPAQGGNGDYVFIDAPAANSTASGSVTISGRAGNSSTNPNGSGDGGTSFADKPQVVIAMIDTGGNPYHADFRDETRLVHPSTYLTGFPTSAKAAPLCFIDGTGAGPFTYHDDCKPSFSENIADDHSNVAVGDLVWYPGTRLMSKSFAHDDVGTPPGIDSGTEDPVLGGKDSLTSHGSWVSSTAVGKKFGTCPDCMLIILEADTVDAIDAAYDWAAKQPWIDVITSSTSVGLIGAGVNPGIFTGNHDAGVTASQNGKIFLVAAGNGAANTGLVPTSTYLYGSSSPALIPVGASSAAGLASHWSDFPAEIMANGNSRGADEPASMGAETAVSGTSFSSPSAAGVLAKSLLEARRACNDYEEGVTTVGSAKTLLRNHGCTVTSGPFANGVLTRDELHEAFVKNAIPAYSQLTTIPGPVGWVKNAYGAVDRGNGLGNGGSSIQPQVTDTILGRQPVPSRALEQFWYDSVVREGQAQMWGPRPVVDGDGDEYPRDDAACMPVCAPNELQRYVEGFAGLSSSATTFQDLFNVLGVSAEQFARATPSGFGGIAQPVHSIGGVIGETGAISVSNDAATLTVRLELAGLLDGVVPTVRSNPVSYEVAFTANHNGVAQSYRLSYEFQALDVLGLLDGNIGTPLTDTFGAFVDTAADAQSGLSSICPIETDLSASHYEAGAAVWVIPLTAFKQSNHPTTCEAFTNDGRALKGGDMIRDITASAILTVGVINFGNGLGAFKASSAEDYTLSGGAAPTDDDGDGVPNTSDLCADTPTGARVDARGCHVALSVNGQPAGTGTFDGSTWSLAIDFSQYTAVGGNYVVRADYGTATESITLTASNGGGSTLNATLTATQYSEPADADGRYPVSNGHPLVVNFAVSTSGGNNTTKRYYMNYGDGTEDGPQLSPNFTHSYGRAGSQHAYAIVTQSNGADSDVSNEVVITTYSTVVVNPGPVPANAALTFDFATSNVAPATVTFSTAGSTGTGYVLDFGDGDDAESPSQISGSGAPPTSVTHRYNAPGTYQAKLTMTGDGDPASATATATITVVAQQQLTAQLSVSPSTVVAGDNATPVTLDASNTVPANGKTRGDYTYAFDFGDGVTVPAGDAMTAQHVYTTAGTFEPKLTVTEKTAQAGQLQQSSVARSLMQSNPLRGSNATIRDFSGQHYITVSTADGTIQGLQPLATPDSASQSVDYPVGFVKYNITNVPANGKVNVTITLPSGLKADGYLKCTRRGCSQLPGVTVSGNLLRFTLEDGGLGDEDGVKNGVISDPGAPTLNGVVVQGTSLAGRGGALDLWLLAPLFGAVLRRRRGRVAVTD